MEHETAGFRSFGSIHDDNDAAAAALPSALVDDPSPSPGPISPAATASIHKAKVPSPAAANQTLRSIANDIIGNYSPFQSPFGSKPLVYADWTASGRALGKVESYIQENVLKYYGNTHTTISITGHQSTCFRHESRQIIAQATNAKITGRAFEDIVLFVGNGTTAAVQKLVQALGLHVPLPAQLQQQAELQDCYRPVVFTSAYEHHSNLLPWRESAAEVVTIAYNHLTGVDLADLAYKLTHEYASRKLKIGSFSAASNVTGVLTDVNSLSILMHKHGGLAFFDYATAAPYVRMDMNPVLLTSDSSDAQFAYKDALFFSGHKFLGGPGCPGVLIVKKSLLAAIDSTPTVPGGGTVFYVTDDHHRYLSNREEREEGGTPEIVGDVKLGLVTHLKQSLASTAGPAWIEEEEMRISLSVQGKLFAHPKLVLLGRDREQPRRSSHLPIFSFLVRHQARFLHYNFVCALLNDLFGVQSRGGCACAGPFSQVLLGLTREANQRIELALLDKHEVLRPGYTRVSFPYWMPQEDIEYVIQAILFVADHGWRFLPLYRYNHKTGEWAHTSRLTRFPERQWLSHFSYGGNYIPSSSVAKEDQSEASLILTADETLRKEWGCDNIGPVFAKIIATANEELAKTEKLFSLKIKGGSQVSGSITGGSGVELGEFDDARWFVLQGDVLVDRLGDSTSDVELGPVHPVIAIDQPLDDSIDSSLSISASAGSAYAQMRDKRLKAHLGGEAAARLPRYVELMMEAGISNSISKNISKVGTSNESNVLNMLMSTGYTASYQPSADSASSSKSLSRVPMATTPSAKPTLIDAPKDESDGNNDEDSSLVCATGTCSFNPRQSSAYDFTPHQQITTAAIMTAEGKVQSGLGAHFPANLAIKPKVTPVPKKILRLVGQAVKEWSMIKEGDRLLLGLSGGKDSLALLHVLLALQKRAPVKFDIACATVDPQTDSFDPSPLIPYVQSLGVTYHYLSEPIVELAKQKLQGDSLCAFCSRFKRGLLYSCCRNFQYNKLVLAQHLDDFAESFMMSALHNGQIRTMKANYEIDAGDVHVIRPFSYVRETMTRDFSRESKLPIINENCPACFEQPKERDRIKKLLKQEESMVPALFYNLKRALTPLMHNDTYEAMKRVSDELTANSQQQQQYAGNGNKSSSRRKALPGKDISGEGEQEHDEESKGISGDSKKRPRFGDNRDDDNDNDAMLVAPDEGEEEDVAAPAAMGQLCSDGLCFEIA